MPVSKDTPVPTTPGALLAALAVGVCVAVALVAFDAALTVGGGKLVAE